jgi:uncharacterized membrane protein (DUF2068 family)
MQQPGMQHESNPRQRRVLRAVAGFELFKGIFVLLMGICALALVHKDVWLYAESLLAVFHISTDRHSAQLFLTFADSVTDARLWAAARIAFAYAVLRFAEGYGLWKGRTWAEWVAFVSGTLLLPLEVRELFRGVTTIRCLLLVGNVALVLYMLYVIMSNRKQRQQKVAKELSVIEMPRRNRPKPSTSSATATPVPKSQKLDSL